ncbi:MAG TPA: DNA methyltransferase [Acidobacteriaceae bacterium]|jgi:16S rRNA G966 N2-methylase RsmD/DNA-directed RNA polymerase subunit RPC12/RpoP
MPRAKQLHLDLGAGRSTRSVGAGRLHLERNEDFARLCNPDHPAKAVKEPFTGEIEAGKNTYVYDAHTYHTKVPPQGIEALIRHYTDEDAVVLDPFCGSGMTGIAATNLNRRAILSDLSPAAVFIAYNLNTPIDRDIYLGAVRAVLRDCEDENRSLYTTTCRRCDSDTPLLYTVWSYGLLCDQCGNEFILWDVARDERESVRESKILSEFRCPHCGKHLVKRRLRRTKRYPVSVGYRCCGTGPKEQTAPPMQRDLDVLDLLFDPAEIPAWYPTDPFPPGINTRQPIAAGIDTIDKAYTPRALRAMAVLWKRCMEWPDDDVRNKLLFTVTSLYQRVTLFSEFRFWGGSGNIANYNVPAISNEQNVFTTFERKANTISWFFRESAHLGRKIDVSTQSATCLSQLPDASVDYVFTDPPFGANINYSEMNFLWESWLRAKTDTTKEAIVNKVQGKDYEIYQGLLTEAFQEIARVLKPGAWLSVVFHNSSDRAWSSLQGSLAAAGFSVDGAQTFDKKHATFKMYVSDNAVGYDLVLHCRKGPLKLLAEAEDVTAAIGGFIRRLSQDQDLSTYTVRFLHVKRADEFDYRRLFSKWIEYSVSRTRITVGFEQFREIAEKEMTEIGLHGATK